MGRKLDHWFLPFLPTLMRLKGIILFILVFGILLQYPTTCQTIYFNKTIDLASNWGSGMSVLANDSSYHIAAITGPGKKISIVEVGITGNEEGWIKNYGNAYESWYPGNSGSLCNVQSGGYILGGTIDTFDTIYGLLLRFNHFFDTVFSKKYLNNINYGLILTCTKPTFDSGYILTGENYFGGYNTDFILLKTDSLGNELWRTTKSIGLADRGWSIIQTPDSGYVVGGYTYIPGLENSGDPLVVKFDKEGNYLWNKRFGGQYPDEEAMICLNEDSTFTVLTTFTDSMYTNEVGYSRVNLIKVSQDGEIIWDRKYCSPLLAIYISNIKKANDGGYICCGMRQLPDTAYDAGWLFRFNSNGDSLWFRDYMYYTQFPGNINQLYDVDIASDDGFIATGQTFMAYPPNNLQKIWILKVDSLGCDTAGCDTTVGIGEQGGREAWGHGGMEVWPNPASGVLSVKCLGLSSGNSYSLMIYDIFGREVFAQTTPSPKLGEGWGGGNGGREGGWQGRTVDVSALPPGIYLSVVKNNNAILGTAKFMIIR